MKFRAAAGVVSFRVLLLVRASRRISVNRRLIAASCPGFISCIFENQCNKASTAVEGIPKETNTTLITTLLWLILQYLNSWVMPMASPVGGLYLFDGRLLVLGVSSSSICLVEYYVEYGTCTAVRHTYALQVDLYTSTTDTTDPFPYEMYWAGPVLQVRSTCTTGPNDFWLEQWRDLFRL